VGKCRIALGRGVAKGQRAGPLFGRSDERDLDVDVAACRFGVRADAVRRIDQLSREVAVDARHADVEARSQEEGIIGRDQVDLGIDRRMGRQRYFLPGGGKLDCADKAGRPSGGEKLFRGWVRIGQLDVETAVGAAREPVAAAGGVSLAGEENLLSHSKILSTLF